MELANKKRTSKSNGLLFSCSHALFYDPVQNGANLIFVTLKVYIYIYCRLIVVGRKIIPVAMELDKDEDSPLYEEVYVEDGVLEENFAYDKTYVMSAG